MSDDFNSAPRVLAIVCLTAEELRALIRSELALGLSNERAMRKLELLASLKAERAPKLSFFERVSLALRVLMGKGRA